MASTSISSDRSPGKALDRLREGAMAGTPKPGQQWAALNDERRSAAVQAVIAKVASPGSINLVEARSDGQVIVTLDKSVPLSKRSGCLLDLEEALKQQVDLGLVVWHQAIGDRNSLRKLRGVTVSDG
jgi:hypothetical protein